MKKNLKNLILLLILGLVFPLTSYASSFPRLNFSDLISGPKTGLNDGVGEGAIITIWGNNLGSSQGTSKIYVGTEGDWHEAAHVYYWKNADGQLPGGPSDLYTYHHMQEITFSIPDETADGANKIKVTVNNVDSNQLDFTVREGDIKYVKTSGTNIAGCGSWDNPCQTIEYLTNATNRVAAGDIIYPDNGVTEAGQRGLIVNYVSGVEGKPISVVAYPGAYVHITEDIPGGNSSITNWNSSRQYWNFAKLSVYTYGSGIIGFYGGRFIANEITGPTANGQGGAITGSGANQRGAVNQSGGGIKIFGNYIHNFGGDNTSKLHHVFYVSNRSGILLDVFELGWNYLKDNKVHHGLHVYDEGICGNWNGELRIHDNVVINQVGDGVGIGSGGTGTCFSMPVEIYNNLFVNTGLDVPGCEFYNSTNAHQYAVGISGTTNFSSIKFYNNSIYGYGDVISPSGTSYPYGNALSIYDSFAGTLELKNNIIVDTKNLPYHLTNHFFVPTTHSNNLWYNGGDSSPGSPPIWDTNPVTSNPLFVSSSDLYLQSNSPAIDGGVDISSTVDHDLFGNSRPMDGNGNGMAEFDLGAYEYDGDYISNDVTAPDIPTGLNVK